MELIPQKKLVYSTVFKFHFLRNRKADIYSLLHSCVAWIALFGRIVRGVPLPSEHCSGLWLEPAQVLAATFKSGGSAIRFSQFGIHDHWPPTYRTALLQAVWLQCRRGLIRRAFSELLKYVGGRPNLTTITECIGAKWAPVNMLELTWYFWTWAGASLYELKNHQAASNIPLEEWGR